MNPFFKRDDKRVFPANGPPAIIGPELSVFGEIETESGLQVDGRVEGTIVCPHLIITENGHVEGVIFAELVDIRGTVRGKVEAVSVKVASTARFKGTLAHNELTIEPGAVMEGLRPWRPPNYQRQRPLTGVENSTQRRKWLS